MRIYATETDFESWAAASEAYEGRPEKLKAKLRSASLVVERMTASAHYRTDEDGYPVDPNVAEAFMEATCYQAAHSATHFDGPSSISAYTSVSLGPLSLGESSNAASQAVARESEEAWAVLSAAGLTGGRVGFPYA